MVYGKEQKLLNGRADLFWSEPTLVHEMFPDSILSTLPAFHFKLTVLFWVDFAWQNLCFMGLEPLHVDHDGTSMFGGYQLSEVIALDVKLGQHLCGDSIQVQINLQRISLTFWQVQFLSPVLTPGSNERAQDEEFSVIGVKVFDDRRAELGLQRPKDFFQHLVFLIAPVNQARDL